MRETRCESGEREREREFTEVTAEGRGGLDEGNVSEIENRGDEEERRVKERS